MDRDGFTNITEKAFAGGAPIDVLHSQTFRENDLLFRELFTSVMCSPLIPKEIVDDDPNSFSPIRIIQRKDIIIESEVVLTEQVPLLWLATEKIEIGAIINGKAKGAPAGKDGDFGGAGGGGTGGKGGDCRLPFSDALLLNGGQNPGDVGETFTNPDDAKAWASRAYSLISFCKGGAGGGLSSQATGAGGLGGGIVFLCAPSIRITTGGGIDVSGVDGSDGVGGGGGGLIVLIGNEIAVEDQNVNIAGGNSLGGGARGGDGIFIKRTIF